jgi:Rps23 Pro-64 3,4-dihydroxylase Tpa1-like proline 4-hydroxylase
VGKAAAQKSGDADGADPLHATLFDEATQRALRAAYGASTPYLHAVVAPLADDAHLRRVRRECIDELRATFKETDLFKVFQVPQDLGAIETSAPDVAARVPALRALRDALYAPRMRALVERATGCAPLSAERIDCSVNVYDKGGHLLCHDDVIGTRTVSCVARRRASRGVVSPPPRTAVVRHPSLWWRVVWGDGPGRVERHTRR